MADSLKNLLIGLFVIGATAIVVFSLLFLHPSIGDAGHTLRVRFADIDKVNIGTRVTFAGKPVGEVTEIKEIEDVRERRIGHEGDVYVYELTLKVDSGINVFDTDHISVRTSGLLGEKNISIDPQPGVPGRPLKLVNEEVIYADQVRGVEDALQEISHLGSKFEQVLDSIQSNLDDLKKQKIFERIGSTAKNLNDITETLNRPEAWSGILNNIHTVSDDIAERVPRSWNILDESLANFKDSSVDFRDMSRKGAEIANNLKNGEGSLGKILVANDLYLRMKSMLSSGETVMDDISRYGILFHLNKRWQRMNARRLNLRNRLATSSEFNQYFNNELNQISSSLSQVSMVLNETEQQPYSYPLMANPEYNQHFGDLMKRASNLDESLKMYNEQVVDEDNAQEYFNNNQ